MKKFAMMTVTISVALLLVGCPEPMVVSLYNNSAGDLTVHYVDGETEWTRGSLLQLQDRELNRLVWALAPIRDQQARVPVLDVSVGSKLLRYSLDGIYSLPPDFVGKVGAVRMRLQLEADGMLYAMRNDQGSSISIPDPQPKTFPIKPTVR